MSRFTAIWAVSKTLQNLLDTALRNEPELSGTTIQVELKSPKEVGVINPNAHTLSVWLYRVTRDEHMVNYPPPRQFPNQLPRPPLPINLYYLITPLSNDQETKQAILGKVLQVFNDHPILGGSDLQASLQGEDEELRITLETLTLEELTKVWQALQENYELSVSYSAQVIYIDSGQEPLQGTPVITKESGYAQIIS